MYNRKLLLLSSLVLSTACTINVMDDVDDGRSDGDDGRETSSKSSSARESTAKAHVLADPALQRILAEVEDEGISFSTETGTKPPKISGYYRKPAGDGKFTATGNGTDVGESVSGMELRYSSADDDED